MSLATRCTACGTVFRVVQDQLKVSEGWVRCGRCDKVFNALEGLFDLSRDTPPGNAAESPTPPSIHGADPTGHGAAVWDAQQSSDASAADKIDAQLGEARPGHSQSTPAARTNERDRLEFPDAEFASDFAEPYSESPPTAGAVDRDRAQRPERDTAAMEPDPVMESSSPAFIRHAHQRARWQSRPARIGLTALAIVLSATLLLQVGHQFRDLLAARWPSTQPAFAAWCGLVACSIQLPKRIEDLSVDSTTLTPAAPPDSFTLAVALRNRSAVAIAVPSVDLILKDAGGQLLARRVLAPGEFDSAPAAVPPGGDTTLQLLLTASGVRVTNYAVEIFYP